MEFSEIYISAIFRQFHCSGRTCSVRSTVSELDDQKRHSSEVGLFIHAKVLFRPGCDMGRILPIYHSQDQAT